MTKEAALKRATADCARREYCRMDIQEKLKRWEVSEEDSESILDILEKEKFIDQERFCRSFINDKLRFSKWGRLKIAHALYQKRIPSGIIQTSLRDIDEDEYAQILQSVIKIKSRSVRGGYEYERKIKLCRFAASRGFEADHIDRCLASFVEDFTDI